MGCSRRVRRMNLLAMASNLRAMASNRPTGDKDDRGSPQVKSLWRHFAR